MLKSSIRCKTKTSIMKDIKYLFAFVAPASAALGLWYGGLWYYAAFVITFVLIPLIEPLLNQRTANILPEEEEVRSKQRWFDFLLYLNIPIVYGIVIWSCYIVSTQNLSTIEWVGICLSNMVVVGADGINVAHELGHRQNKAEQWLAKILLLPALYMHFIIEHNLGHHKNVATAEDPASARKGEIIYSFFFRSVYGNYVNAWKLEAVRLKKMNLSWLNIKNEMIWFQLIQLSYLLCIYYFFSTKGLLLAIISAVLGFLILEAVNYIEHYGLSRRKLPSGRFEPVDESHSWNSNHELGRIFLYELTRHSDHHFKSTRKYQILRHFDKSPQLPLGYPGSILIALMPPLWFHLMNPKVKSIEMSRIAV